MSAFRKQSPAAAVIGVIGLLAIPAIVSAAVAVPTWILRLEMSRQVKLGLLITGGLLGVAWLIGFWFFCEDDIQ